MRRLSLAILTLAVAACHSGGNVVGDTPVAIAPAGRLLITGVTVVDVRTGALAPQRAVLIEGGRIVRVAAAGAIAAEGARVVDAPGRFLVPGFNDMHAHVLSQNDDPAGRLALLLASGVTGFRQMHGSEQLLAQRKAHLLPLTSDAPALLAAPGALLTPLNARDAADAVATMHAQQAQGADFVKVALVSAGVFEAVLAESRKTDQRTAGHVPADFDVLTASRLGFGAIEHLGPSPGLIVACSKVRAELLAAAPKPPFKGPPFRIPFAEAILERLLKKKVVNPVLAFGAKDVPRLRRAIDTFDEGQCREVAAQLAADGDWHIPTLIRLHSSRFADAPEYANDPNLKYVSPKTLALWQEIARDYAAEVPAETRQTLRDGYALDLRIVKRLDAAGVKLLTGSDVTGAGWLVPGFSLHQEFDQLATAGLSPLRVLQMTTLNAAEFLERAADFGAVEAGRQADLVLLEANPLESVANLRRIAGVIRAGHYKTRADLDALLRQVAANPPDS